MPDVLVVECTSLIATVMAQHGALVVVSSNTETIGSLGVYLSRYFSRQFGLGPHFDLAQC